MKRRMFSLVLALTLAVGCGILPAAALPAPDPNAEELTQVTLSVKGQLGIGDEYTKFSSDCTDLGVIRYWSLDWSDDDVGYLNVTATSAGKIMSYDCYAPDSNSSAPSWYGSGFNPSFPPATAKQVEDTAQEFLAKVLQNPESAALEPVTLRVSGNQTRAYVYGTLLLNGVSSPTRFTLRVNLTDLSVSSYYRYDAWNTFVFGEVPSAQPAVSEADAGNTLHSALTMELQYVDADDETIALRYVPTTRGNWYVDAQTGELVDLSQLQSDRFFPAGDAGGAENSAAADAEAPMPAPTLSPVEQATVDQMASALDAQTLDTMLREIAALGLENMTQAGASYYMDRESGEITCRLTYTRPLTREETKDYISDEEFAAASPALRKYITVDAMDGALHSVSTHSGFAKDLFTGDSAAVVKEFLSQQYPDYFAACSSTNDEETVYTRMVNDIPYYSNYLRASVCMVDGSIGSFSLEWDDDAQFPAPEGLVGMDAALAVYASCYETQLYYTAYPEKVDTSDPDWLTYSQRMGDVAYRWVLSYVLNGDSPAGVDAFTGEAVAYPWNNTAAALHYTDCEGCYGKEQINALSEYGIGFSRTEEFRPTAQVTQRDMLVLLLSTVGCTFDADDMDAEQEDMLYETAYSSGLLTQDQRDPDHAVTRLEFVKTLLCVSPYGKAAQIEGIFRVGFADADDIASADLGYAAIAEGLGIVGGNEAGYMLPNAHLTRQDAAIMLYRFMSV